MNNSFEMKENIDWYNQNKDNIVLPDETVDSNIELEGLLKDISIRRLNALYSLFSENAHERSLLGKIVAKPEAYFSKNVEEQIQNNIDPRTESLDDALSPTAIVPSYCFPQS